MRDATTGTAFDRAGLRGYVLGFLGRSRRDAGITEPLPELTDDDNLFDLGLVDSLTLAELLILVERLSGVELDLLTVEPESFLTLRGILDHLERARDGD